MEAGRKKNLALLQHLLVNSLERTFHSTTHTTVTFIIHEIGEIDGTHYWKAFLRILVDTHIRKRTRLQVLLIEQPISLVVATGVMDVIWPSCVSKLWIYALIVSGPTVMRG